jgi:hypothetical protein
MIILLSGDGKYSMEGADLESVLESGRRLYLLLKGESYEEFALSLSQLHSFVKANGKHVEILRNADVIIPPLSCDPRILGSIMGLHNNP